MYLTGFLLSCHSQLVTVLVWLVNLGEWENTGHCMIIVSLATNWNDGVIWKEVSCRLGTRNVRLIRQKEEEQAEEIKTFPKIANICVNAQDGTTKLHVMIPQHDHPIEKLHRPLEYVFVPEQTPCRLDDISLMPATATCIGHFLVLAVQGWY